jgi:N-acetylmuramoyl-L-alanine amidase
VRSGTPEPGSARLVFDLRGDTVAIRPHMESNANGRVLVIEWPDDGEGDARPVAASSTQATTPTATSEPQRVEQPPVQQPVVERPPVVVAPPPNTTPTAQAPVRTVADVAKRGGGRPLLIAIDAGHGGQDTGAHGASGSLEKNITLQVAKELARQVNATPGMKAYLTRDSDFFIPLVRRYQLARQHKADMFVAIHADAFTDPSASGSSVWVLSRRGQTSQAARWLADQENAADLVGGVRLRDKDNTLASVLLDLSQSATQRASEEIAGQVLRGLADLGKTHRGEIDRANFVVLRSPDVPSMLVETAFISNPGEERKLNNPDYQRELARAVLNGIHTYFRRQPPPGTQYAAMYMGGGSSNTAARP